MDQGLLRSTRDVILHTLPAHRLFLSAGRNAMYTSEMKVSPYTNEMKAISIQARERTSR